MFVVFRSNFSLRSVQPRRLADCDVLRRHEPVAICSRWPRVRVVSAQPACVCLCVRLTAGSRGPQSRAQAVALPAARPRLRSSAWVGKLEFWLLVLAAVPREVCAAVCAARTEKSNGALSLSHADTNVSFSCIQHMNTLLPPLPLSQACLRLQSVSV